MATYNLTDLNKCVYVYETLSYSYATAILLSHNFILHICTDKCEYGYKNWATIYTIK